MKACSSSLKTVTVTKLSHDGRGVARDNDKVVFVFGALPDETVEIQLTRAHRQYNEAKCINVIEPSPSRVKPRCEYFGLCGGCQLQHFSPEKQIEYKAHLLDEQLKQANVEVKTWAPPLAHAFFGYRQKARLGVKYVDKKEALLVGFREQSSNKIAMIERCEILDPRVGNHIHDLKAMITRLSAKRHIPQIEVAIAGEEVALVFRHLQPLDSNDIAILTEFCQERHYSLYLQPGSSDSVHAIWPHPQTTELEYTLAEQGLRFRFHPLDFIQVNPTINQSMINQALDWLATTRDDTVLDLFCGLGNFSLPLAQRAKKVVGVEGSPNMVLRAKNNAQLNSLENVEFYSTNLDDNWEKESWAKDTYSQIVLDPPRSGAEKVVDNINRLKAKKILYVSCNPATFVRDAAILTQRHGYTLEKCGVMDMFSQTAHVETMGLFVRK